MQCQLNVNEIRMQRKEEANKNRSRLGYIPPARVKSKNGNKEKDTEKKKVYLVPKRE